MHTPGETPSQASPNFARFNDLHERLADLVRPVTIDILDLGTSASVTCKPKSAAEIEVEYKGVSERGQALSDRFTLRLDPNAAAPYALATAAGTTWRLGHLPRFHVAEDDECLVGPSEDIRIREALPRAITSYLDDHPDAVAAAELLRLSRRQAVQEAGILTAEARLAFDRRALAATEHRVTELETELESVLEAGSPPTP